MTSYKSGHDGDILPALSQEKIVFFYPYNKSLIDQACSVKMAGYWPLVFFLCEFMDLDSVLGP